MGKTLWQYLTSKVVAEEKPTGLPTKKSVAKDLARADFRWTRYFGKNFFHQYWSGRGCPTYDGCGTCSGIGISTLVTIISSLFACLFAFAGSVPGIGITAFQIWMGINGLIFSIPYVAPVISNWNNRRKIYNQYCAQISTDRGWNEIQIPMLRKLVNDKFAVEFSQLEASLKPLELAYTKLEDQQKFVTDEKNLLTDRDNTLADLENQTIANRVEQETIRRQIGDKKVLLQLNHVTIDKLESKTRQMPVGDTLSEINVTDVVSSVAMENGLDAVDVPAEFVSTAIIVDELTRDEIRKRAERKVASNSTKA